MRISIPSIPSTSSIASVEYSLAEATAKVCELLERGNGKTLLLTGAGVSVDSGIASYRGAGGHYTIHKTYRPIFYPEFVDSTSRGHQFRQRYWSRSFLGFKPVQYAHPNPTHYSIAALQRMGYIPEYITQNVDNLHHAATPSPSLAAESITELHGTLQHIVCVSSGNAMQKVFHSPQDPINFERLRVTNLSGPRYAEPRPWNTPTGEAYPKGCGFRGSRSRLQDLMEETNPLWHEFAQDVRAKGTEPKTNPDGDVDLGNVNYSTFKYPPCPNCGGVLKPAVIFFGESVPSPLRDRAASLVARSNSMLLVGTSLATYSAFRLVKQAVEEGQKPCVIINQGPTRADSLLLGDDAHSSQAVAQSIVEPSTTRNLKIELGSSEVLVEVARTLASRKKRYQEDPVIQRLLSSGEVVKIGDRPRGVVSS